MQGVWDTRVQDSGVQRPQGCRGCRECWVAGDAESAG